MATRRKKVNGIDLPSTNTDPLRTELGEVFKEYPEGAAIAHEFLTGVGQPLFIDIQRDLDIWRVRRDCVDRLINGVSDRVQLKCLENSKSTEP